MAPYLGDFRGRRSGDALAVLLPASTAEAAAAVASVTSRGLPVFPQGGNTGLCYGAVPRGGVVIGLKRMRGVRQADIHSGLLTVDAGMTLAEVHVEAEKLGLQFPLYLGSEGTAQIGGLISTNAGGTGVLRYGAMRDLIAGVELVLADGRVLSDLGGLRKNNTGYSMSQLVAGAEGTLGVVTAAVLRLAPRMQSRAHAWLGFEHVEPALEVATRIRASFGTLAEAIELIDRNEASYVSRHFPDIRMPLSALPDWSLMIELASPRSDDILLPPLEELLAGAMEEGLIADAVIAQNEAQAREIWHFRHSVTEANKLTGVGVVLDTSVRPSEIAGFIADADRVAAERFPQAERAIVAHLADGNVHYILMFPHEIWAAYPDKEARELDVETAIHDVAIAHGGSFSAEHGIGRKLTEEMTRLIDPVRLDLMRGIKDAFDPKGLMNPGVLLAQTDRA
ncbi:FAD-binding oxidoreductase [Paracoccus sp. SCSIO 75233]|uniref:FAD-binding oxidoreductase n=1 Tax=Paracoccus sp. SCSIO 75233 TaxID=3017782 RepID=UPI0022F0013D|nr:FAD-binding oxidoreductase [Paracoccus sp. SCSIO 75233]WBU54755.1 FAD-binding oxidoreductase [Paracoccus sp. SCSIO 75233]